MKKILCIVLITVLLMLTACAPSDGPYKFERSGIESVVGNNTTVTPTKSNVQIKERDIDGLLKQLEALCAEELEPLDIYPGGYDYGFTVIYEDGSYISVSIVDDEQDYIKIGTKRYALGSYNPSDLSKYFE